MMRKLALILLILCCLVSPVLAQGLILDEPVVARGIENRAPVQADSTFPSDVGKLYCLTKVSGAPTEGATITHVWYWKDKEMFKKDLPVQYVKSGPWRTYSVKNVLPQWKGTWRVDIVYDGTVLKTVNFTVE